MNIINNEFNAKKTAGTRLKPRDLRVGYGTNPLQVMVYVGSGTVREKLTRGIPVLNPRNISNSFRIDPA